MFITHFIRDNHFVKVMRSIIIQQKLIIHAEHGSSAQLTLLPKWLIQRTFAFVTCVLEILHEAQTQWVNKRTQR